MVGSLVNKLKGNFLEAKWIAQKRVELARNDKRYCQDVDAYILKRREFDSRQGSFLWMCAIILGYMAGTYSRFCLSQSSLNDFDREIKIVLGED